MGDGTLVTGDLAPSSHSQLKVEINLSIFRPVEGQTGQLWPACLQASGDHQSWAGDGHTSLLPCQPPRPTACTTCHKSRLATSLFPSLIAGVGAGDRLESQQGASFCPSVTRLAGNVEKEVGLPQLVQNTPLVLLKCVNN